MRVWLITDCRSGFGRALAAAVVAHGDRLVATTRDPAALADLTGDGVLTARLDVTDAAWRALRRSLTAQRPAG